MLTNNDILKKLRVAHKFTDDDILKVLKLVDFEISKSALGDFFRNEDHPKYVAAGDQVLRNFLNGLIIEKRGRKEGPQPEPESKLNHNIVFRKLKIALDLKDDDILAILQLSDFRLSKHELSAFFRRPDHHHYRACQDQVLRNFIKGVQLQLRQDSEE